MQADANEESSINKLLLLGAGESGKSTLFKQMNAIYGSNPFPDSEREGFKAIIFQNIIDSMKILISKVDEWGEGQQIAIPASRAEVEGLPREASIDPPLAAHLIKLWKDSAIQVAYKNRAKFQLTDSADYFFERLVSPSDAPSKDQYKSKVGEDNYLPSTQDVLRSRVRTTGIVMNKYDIEGNKFELYDVGGQRNERKKWIHCFDNVTAVLFVGVLSEYDQTLYEDDTTNRMVETVKLFAEVVGLSYFAATDFILFLNKRDLFEKKILTSKLTDCPLFQDYDDSINNYEAGCEVITEKFREKAPGKNIYPHITCATDTNLCKELLAKVTMIIIQGSLADAGLV